MTLRHPFQRIRYTLVRGGMQSPFKLNMFNIKWPLEIKAYPLQLTLKRELGNTQAVEGDSLDKLTEALYYQKDWESISTLFKIFITNTTRWNQTNTLISNILHYQLVNRL